MLRRFPGQFQVGRLAPKDREKIIKDKMKEIKTTPDVLEYMLKGTSNFTGAALVSQISYMKENQEFKRKQNNNEALSLREMMEASDLVCTQYRNKLGLYSLPRILFEQSSKKFSFNMKFMEKILHQTLIVSKKKDGRSPFTLTYGTAFEINNVEKR